LHGNLLINLVVMAGVVGLPVVDAVARPPLPLDKVEAAVEAAVKAAVKAAVVLLLRLMTVF